MAGVPISMYANKHGTACEQENQLVTVPRDHLRDSDIRSILLLHADGMIAGIDMVDFAGDASR